MRSRIDQLNISMQRLLARQEQSIDEQERSLVCELSALADRIGDIPNPPRLSRLQRFSNWILSLFGKTQSKAKEQAYLDATLANLKGRVRKDYPVHERPAARDMIAKVFHVRRELLTPLKAHFPQSPELSELDDLLLRVRDRYGSRVPFEEQAKPKELPISPTTHPASIAVNAQRWIKGYQRAGYSVQRTKAGHFIASKGKLEPQIIVSNGNGGYSQLCDFRRGTINTGGFPENPGFTVSWVNGIKTSFTRSIERAEVISTKLQAPVHYLHNPKKGLYTHVEDSRRYLKGRSDSEEVLALVHHWRSLLDASDRDVLHICHSQGAALTKLAASHLTEGERERIHVRSFGGLLPIEPKDGFASQENYISSGDRLITSLNSQAQRATRGRAPDHYRVVPSAGSAKKSHTLSEGSPYHRALHGVLAEWNLNLLTDQ